MKKKKSVLGRLMETPDNLLPDDDHPFRPSPFTKREMKEVGKELYEKHKNDAPLKAKNNELANATVDALNKL